VLLDNPATIPMLGFGDIARAFATIISESEPRFAIGIFGGWGSGKTTMMRAIKTALPARGIVQVDFNAWRFEREPQLLVPLLDTIRVALMSWSEPQDLATRERVRSAATRIGRVVRALAAGLSAEVNLLGAAKVSYDISAALDALTVPGEPVGAQSLYVAAFRELDNAFQEFAAGGANRVVVFVDDLDRCLPASALEVLDVMKLFFDLPGFVFVVGLDEEVVDRAIRARFAGSGYRDAAQPGRAPAGELLGREYLKKIFQLPYSLPVMMPHQLGELLESIYREAGLDGSSFAEIRDLIRQYLQYVTVERHVNPREVKRFINSYTLQTLIRPELDADTVLALQTLAFRYDWELLYNAILDDTAMFVDILRRYREDAQHDPSAFEDLSPDLLSMPPSLLGFLRSAQAEPLARHATLDAYVTSLEATRSSKSWESVALRQVGQLGREIRNALSQLHITDAILMAVLDAARKTIGTVTELLPQAEYTEDRGLSAHLTRIRSLAEGSRLDIPDPEERRKALLTQLQVAVEDTRRELRMLRNASMLAP
jgi:hypothetical protein